MVVPLFNRKANDSKGLSRVTTYNHTTNRKMKSDFLKEHLINSDLSFLEVVKDEIKSSTVEALQPEPQQPQNWSNDIAELENYFASIELPTQPVKLNRCSTITDCSLFIESHFATVKGNNGNRTFLPYLNRLQELKQVLTINSN